MCSLQVRAWPLQCLELKCIQERYFMAVQDFYRLVSLLAVKSKLSGSRTRGAQFTYQGPCGNMKLREIMSRRFSHTHTHTHSKMNNGLKRL